MVPPKVCLLSCDQRDIDGELGDGFWQDSATERSNIIDFNFIIIVA